MLTSMKRLISFRLIFVIFKKQIIIHRRRSLKQSHIESIIIIKIFRWLNTLFCEWAEYLFHWWSVFTGDLKVFLAPWARYRLVISISKPSERGLRSELHNFFLFPIWWLHKIYYSKLLYQATEVLLFYTLPTLPA